MEEQELIRNVSSRSLKPDRTV